VGDGLLVAACFSQQCGSGLARANGVLRRGAAGPRGHSGTAGQRRRRLVSTAL